MKCHCCENEIKTRGAKHCSYSCRSSCQEHIEIRRKKYKERHGYDHQSQDPAVKDKKRKTFIERYGVDTITPFKMLDSKGENNPFFGKKHTKEAIAKMRNPDRVDQEIRYLTKKLCHGLLWRVIYAFKNNKTGKTYELLGYTPSILRSHLESLFTPGMNWENHGRGRGKWNIDHIRPINTFPVGTSFSEINALSNIRPLWSEENVRRPKDGRDVDWKKKKES